jgi:uncharacterized membrane protein YfcA
VEDTACQYNGWYCWRTFTIKHFRKFIPHFNPLFNFSGSNDSRISAGIEKIVEVHLEKSSHHKTNDFLILCFIFLAAIYGGYFGAGLGGILLAILGLLIDDSLIRLNALKQAISLSVNVSAAIYFAFSDKVNWLIVAVMIFGSVAGGMIGGKTATYIKPGILRWAVVITGFAVAAIYFIK